MTSTLVTCVLGQDPSHIALEVAMQTHPNLVLLAEDVRAKRWSLHDIVREVCDVIQARSEAGKQFGAVVVSIWIGCPPIASLSNFLMNGYMS